MLNVQIQRGDIHLVRPKRRRLLEIIAIGFVLQRVLSGALGHAAHIIDPQQLPALVIDKAHLIVQGLLSYQGSEQLRDDVRIEHGLCAW